VSKFKEKSWHYEDNIPIYKFDRPLGLNDPLELKDFFFEMSIVIMENEYKFMVSHSNNFYNYPHVLPIWATQYIVVMMGLMGEIGIIYYIYSITRLRAMLNGWISTVTELP
jgi:hypothetical protein